MITDEELFREWQSGSTAALEILVQRYHAPLLAYLFRLLGDLQLAEDLVQEFFARLVRDVRTYHYPRPFRPWLYAIAHHLAFNQHQNIPSSYIRDNEDLPPELRLIAQRYATQPVPHPTPEDTAHLLARLLSEETVVALSAAQERWFVLRTLRVARWRVRLLGPWFWIAGVLLLIFGALLAPIMNRNNAIMTLILLIPLTAVLGLAHALRTT